MQAGRVDIEASTLVEGALRFRQIFRHAAADPRSVRQRTVRAPPSAYDEAVWV